VTILVLPPTCDRAAARAFLPDIRDALGPNPMIVDASEVERIGQAMLQVLVAAARSDSGITIASPSAAFTEVLRLSGLDQVLASEIGDAACSAAEDGERA
jgi:anti-anti-sigma regulatory factor